MSKTRMGTLALGLILGSVAGVGAALLAAPQSGEQTREMLLEKGVEFQDKASQTLEKGRGKARELLESVNERAGQVGGGIRGRLNSASTHIKEIVAE